MTLNNKNRWLAHVRELRTIPSCRSNVFKNIEIFTYKQDGWVGEFFLDNTQYFVYGELSRERTLDKCCEEIIIITMGLDPYAKYRID